MSAMKEFSTGRLVRRSGQWFITGLANSDYGPYDTALAAKDERRDIIKAMKSAGNGKAGRAKKEAKPKAKATKPESTKKERAAKKAKAPKADGKLSAIDAAAKVLAGAGEPMNCKALIEAMAEKGLWTSPGGKTPWATLYSALLREINEKGKDARFVKVERGKFAAKK